MNRTDLDRCALLASTLALAAGLLIWPVVGVGWALCLCLSTAWGAANFWLLGRTLMSLAGAEARPLAGVAWVLIKLPVLFGGAAALVMSPVFSASALLIGLHVVILTAVVTIAGRQWITSAATPSGERA
jgi:hypothetical protein